MCICVPVSWAKFIEHVFSNFIYNSLYINGRFGGQSLFKEGKKLETYFLLYLQRVQKPCSLGLHCSVCEKELLPVTHGKFCESPVMFRLTYHSYTVEAKPLLEVNVFHFGID